LQSNFTKLQETFLHDASLVLLSFTVTPEIDTKDVLTAYAEANQVNARKWHLLTGSREEIYTLARSSYFAEKENVTDREAAGFLHTEHFILVDRQLHIRGIYNGTLELEIQRLIDDIRLLQAEG
jgi:protein SCO1/2